MAKLIVSRPQQAFKGLRRPYRILIDGQRVASIGGGGKVEIPIPPGRHQVRAAADFVRSQPVEIEASPEGVYYLGIGSRLPRRGPLTFAWFLCALAPLGLLLISSAVERWLGPSFETGWFIWFIGPLFSVLPFVLLLVVMVVWRDHFLYLDELPALDPTAGQVVFPAVQPVRVRITIRQMMIAVAFLAVLLGAGVEWARYTRQGYFREKAKRHAQAEAMFREFEQETMRQAADWEKRGVDVSPFRKMAARHAGRADHHAAMRRKYEQTASRREFFVEPDPPEPPWP